jgi:hypothetical protein
MEETKLLNYIQKISDTFSKFCKFDIYDEDDIRQEIFFLINKAEPLYDENRGDEYTFYSNFVVTRLKNVKRDRYLLNDDKKNIADAKTLEEDIEEVLNSYLSKYIDEIDECIAANVRADYLRFKEGAKIPHRNKHIVIQHIKDIVGRIENRKKAHEAETDL